MNERQALAAARLAQTKFGCPCSVLPHSGGSFAVLVKRDLLPGQCPDSRFSITNCGQAVRVLGLES